MSEGGERQFQGGSSQQEGEGEFEWGWTRMQRLGVATFTVILLVMAGVEWRTHQAAVPEPLPITHEEVGEETATIDPNVASAAELVAIGFPQKSAEALVAYRESHGEGAFVGVEDLRRITGLTKKVLEDARPYLRFPVAATQGE